MAILYPAAILIMLISGLPAWLAGNGLAARRAESLSALLLAGGSLLGLTAVLASLASQASPQTAWAWSLLPGARLAFRLDSLAAVFLLPIFLVSGLGGIYGLGYMPQAKLGTSAGRVRLLYGIVAASIAALPGCRNAILFLVAWELMALGSFLLVLTEQEKEESRRAAFVYLAYTHTATLALYALFVLLARQVGSFDFPPPASLDAAAPIAPALFLLALFGFGVKAGLMPLHSWLPEAHAATPSHVSALMSGVMIKMGIYGLVRITSFFFHIPPWWGWSVLLLGVVSAVLGVAFAIAQHDIKRLLAYHSVENIGIILIGLGLSLLGRSFGQPALAALGLAGALLHVINHGLFKSLLFLGAGAVIKATGTRRLDACGGLLKLMPVTGLCFLGGAVAICGLPPANGFVSEWLIYLGLLHSVSGQTGFSPLSLAVIAAPFLALTGALAVACFVKVCGVVFLGEARVKQGPSVAEAPVSMRAPMLILLAACLLIGVLPGMALPLLARALGQLGALPSGPAPLNALAPAGGITLSALLLAGTGAMILWLRRQLPARAAASGTWGCGYPNPSPRMQYSAASFAELLTGLFAWGLRTEIKGEPPFGFFPAPARFADHTPEVLLDLLLYPLCRWASRLAFRARTILQHGVLGVYLLYVALTLGLLLALSL